VVGCAIVSGRLIRRPNAQGGVYAPEAEVTKKVSYGHLHLQGIFTQMPRRQPSAAERRFQTFPPEEQRTRPCSTFFSVQLLAVVPDCDRRNDQREDRDRPQVA
jgi:hypothetical protein